MCSSDIFLGLLAILFPPIAGTSDPTFNPIFVRSTIESLTVVAVWIKSGICTADSLINILLCTLGYIPGLLRTYYQH